MGAKLVYMPFGSNGKQSIPYDLFSMLSAKRHADVLLILGVSGCAFLPIIKLFSKKKFIVHLDGIDWRRPKWGWAARNFLRFSEWVAAKSADCLIADNAAIQNYIFESYGQDSFLIEYGGDHSVCVSAKSDSKPEPTTALGKDANNLKINGVETGFSSYAFSVCRIEPENNIDIILEAFARNKSLPLVIVGNWSYSDYGKSLRAQYGGHENMLLLDPIYDPVELFPIRSNATVYLHGHSAGGTNPSLVEAMYLGLPILAFDVEFNRATTDNKAKYFADADRLVAILANLNIGELAQLARRMGRVAEFRYTWRVIADKYAYLFKALGESSIKKVRLSEVIANMPEPENLNLAFDTDIEKCSDHGSDRVTP